MDADVPQIKVRRFERHASKSGRKKFAQDLMRALDRLGVPPGGEFVVAPYVVQQSLEEPDVGAG